MGDLVSPAARSETQRLAHLFLEDLDQIASHLTAFVLAEEPGIADERDATSVAAVRDAARSNAGAILSMLAFGVPSSATEESEAAKAFFERQAEHEDGLAAVLRTYRIGIAELWQLWARFVEDHVANHALVSGVLALSTAHMHDFGDRISVESVEHWTETRRRRRGGSRRPMAEVVRDALFNDRYEALNSFGYDPLGGHLAIAIAGRWSDDDAVARAAESGRLVGAPAVALAQQESLVVWIGVAGIMPNDAQLAAVSAGGPAGISSVHRGLAGFRDSHREACDAARIGGMRGDDGCTHHHEIALLAALSADEQRAQALMVREAGPLLGDDEGLRDLRASVLAYLACGNSHVRAAARLHVHEKTVAYRIKRAERLLGQRILDRRAELEAALLLHDVLRPSET